MTLLPRALARRTGAHVDPRAALVVGAAVFLHTLGMAWAYDSVWWWDHLTHTLSAAVVASVAAVAARTVEARTTTLWLPGAAMAGYLFVCTLAAGVVWELLEFFARNAATTVDLEPVLIVYGVGDTVLDLVFDGVGALVVSLWGHVRG